MKRQSAKRTDLFGSEASLRLEKKSGAQAVTARTYLTDTSGLPTRSTAPLPQAGSECSGP
jgi:hypothetical protein